MMALAESDSWQRYGLKPDSRQRIALTASFPAISLLWKHRTSAGRRGNVMLIIRQKYPLGNSGPDKKLGRTIIPTQGRTVRRSLGPAVAVEPAPDSEP
jgi:hypothetical protein